MAIEYTLLLKDKEKGWNGLIMIIIKDLKENRKFRLFAGRLGFGLTFFITLLAVCRNGVIADYAFMKYILWVVPPISDVVSWFTNESYFNMGEVTRGFILLLIYGAMMAVMKVELLRRVKF